MVTGPSRMHPFIDQRMPDMFDHAMATVEAANLKRSWLAMAQPSQEHDDHDNRKPPTSTAPVATRGNIQVVSQKTRHCRPRENLKKLVVLKQIQAERRFWELSTAVTHGRQVAAKASGRGI